MTARTVTAFAPAKVNLALHVTGRRDDGYHLLDSLVVFARIGDQISAEPSEALSITVSGPNADGIPTDARNLMMKAARLLDP
ncbi:MAG: 4-diphosphocytidyl-2-C-methyl-D-erythritol kinase, partial [Polaromonas sp.]